MRKLIIIPILLGLSACVTTRLPNATQRDIDECEYEGEKASPNNPIIARSIMIKCLKLRGAY